MGEEFSEEMLDEDEVIGEKIDPETGLPIEGEEKEVVEDEEEDDDTM